MVRVKAVADLFIEKFGERFRRTAAAREFHHARRGGLVEHVAQMMRSAAAICSVYHKLNEDLLIVGVLFHDCGKLWETAYAENSFSMPYHLSGEMMGHITLGLELVNKLWRDVIEKPEAAEWMHLEPASDHVRLHLLHLIGSHHGELAFGSPVLPKTPEAIALHYIDNLDAKLDMFRRGYETSNEIAPGIFERVRPLPQNLVEPLPRFVPHVPVDQPGE
jgi:3'-5' exoribonuclease